MRRSLLGVVVAAVSIVTVPSAQVPGDRPAGNARGTRSVAMARNGMIATSQALASGAGLRVLQDGGNAIDAAITAAGAILRVQRAAGTDGHVAADREGHWAGARSGVVIAVHDSADDQIAVIDRENAVYGAVMIAGRSVDCSKSRGPAERYIVCKRRSGNKSDYQCQEHSQ